MAAELGDACVHCLLQVIELWQSKEGRQQGEFLVRIFYNQEELVLDGAKPGINLPSAFPHVRVSTPHLLLFIIATTTHAEHGNINEMLF